MHSGPRKRSVKWAEAKSRAHHVRLLAYDLK
jgi:hypothetical protein